MNRVATGLQDKFSWRGVAAAAAGVGVGRLTADYLLGASTPGANGQPSTRVQTDTTRAFSNMFGSETQLMGAALSGMAGGLTTAALRGGKISAAQIMTDAFGNAIGEEIGAGLLEAARPSIESIRPTGTSDSPSFSGSVASEERAPASPTSNAGQAPYDEPRGWNGLRGFGDYAGEAAENWGERTYTTSDTESPGVPATPDQPPPVRSFLNTPSWSDTMSWDERFRRYGSQVAAAPGGIQYDSSFQTGGSTLTRGDPGATGTPNPASERKSNGEGWLNERRRDMIDPTREPIVAAAGTGLAALAAVVWGKLTGDDALVQAGMEGPRDLGLSPTDGTIAAASLLLGGRQGRSAPTKPLEVAPSSPKVAQTEPPVMGANDGPQLPPWGGQTDYSGVPNPRNVDATSRVTPRQVREMKATNRENNGGVLRDDVTGEFGIDSKKSTRGTTPPPNEIQVDHKKPVDAGGGRENTNLELRLRKNNRAKSNQWNGNK